MRNIKQIILALAAIGILNSFPVAGRGATLHFTGTQYDLGGTFFPTYSFPQNSIVPWRSDSPSNIFAVSNSLPDRYYGTAGYAMFATRFDFPDATSFPGNPSIPPTGSSDYPDLVDLPDFVASSQVLATRMAGGFAYALIDDPRLQQGIRYWTFDGTNYPPPDGTNTTGVVPYVKLGILDGLDQNGNNPTLGQLTDRWSFTVGANAPYHFRLGVMTDGLDGDAFVPTEVVLRQAAGNFATTGVVPIDEPGEPITPGVNRFVDMHFFDITGARPGDEFIISVNRTGGGGFSAGVSGFSFDVVQQTLPGDFDSDLDVDGADFVVWQTHFPTASGATLADGDADGDGDVDGADFVVWQTHFPTTPSPGVAPVPEPDGLWLIGLGAATLMLRHYYPARMRTVRLHADIGTETTQR